MTVESVVTTEKLLALLQERSLGHVTKTMLDNDIHDGFLPHRPWGPSIIPRATYLYRLRKRDVLGSTLKLMLFLRDGWGWESVKPTIREGIRKSVRSSQTGLRKVMRKPNKPQAIAFLLDNIAEAQRDLFAAKLPESRAAEISATSLKTLGFVFGMGLFGSPLDGGSLEQFIPIARALNQSDDATTNELRYIVEAALSGEKMTWKKQMELLKEIDDDTAAEAVPGVRQFFHDIRRVVHKGACEEGRPEHSSNPLTLFGNWKRSRYDGFWRRIPQRITPAQMLGSVIGVSVLAHVLLNRSPAGKILNLLAALEESASNTDSTIESGAPDPR